MPRPVFLGRPIPTATNPLSDEVGGSIGLGNGNVLAYWQQDRLDGNAFVSEGVNIRIIDSVARTVGAVIALDLGPDSARATVPEVVALANGNFVVSWTNAYVSGVGVDVFFRVFDAQGAALTPITQADPRNAAHGSADGLDITALSNGGFVAAWGQYHSGSYDCYAQTYDASGAAVSAVVQLNAFVRGGQSYPEIQALEGGRFIAVWTDQGGPYSLVDGTSQVARLFQADGTPISPAFRVNQSINGSHDTSHALAVTELSGGNIAMVWQHSVDTTDGSGRTIDTIVTRVFSSTGAAMTPETAISVAAADMSAANPSITALQDGRFITAWTEYTFNSDLNERFTHVVARIIGADGSMAAAPFIVEQAGANWATSPTVSTLLDGRVAITYSVQSDPLGRPDLLTQIIDPRVAAVDLHGTSGDDHMLGTRMNDSIAGGLGADRLNGGVGDDRVLGEMGNDTLAGGVGNDQIFGGAGQDRLSGGVGRDTLIGGAGNDVMTGGADGDSFVFQPGAGADRITDFDISQDVLNLRSLHFADATAALAAFSQTAGGAVFSHGGDTVLLSGIDAADLTSGMLLI